jgi:tetratricopeptide (TPR) repeat protein
MKKFRRYYKPAALLLLALLGSGSLWLAQRLSQWESAQVVAYNQGIAAFRAEKVDEAMVAFDKSLDAYTAAAQRDWLDKQLYPGRSSELAALAMSKKALLLLMKQKPELAVKAFKDSLQLNPGVVDVALLKRTMKDEALSPQDVARLSEQSAVVKFNLELLFRKNPTMQQSEGKGKGKPSDKDGKPGDQPANGSKPGPGSGKGNPNAI